MRKISIIIPTIRPESTKRCIELIYENAGLPADQYEIVQEVDIERIGCPKMVKRLVSKAQHDLIMFLGDDTLPQKDFLKNALTAMDSLPDGWGIVGLNTHSQFHQHWLAHKKMLPYLNGELFCTEYRHCFCDNELRDIAVEMDRWILSENSSIFHGNPLLQNKALDTDLQKAYSRENWNHDKKLYLKRRDERHQRTGYQKLAIGFPITDEMVYTEFLKTWTLMEKPNYTFCVPIFHGRIEEMRNQIVSQALNQACTHLLMMDTDQIYPADTIPKLLSHDVDVVGGVVHRRYPPFDAILYRGKIGKYIHVSEEECYSGKLVKVDATGCGCVLYNTKVFIDIPSPWFEVDVNPEGKSVGEDIKFCSKLRDVGYDIHVDTSIEIGHMSLMIVNRSTYELFKKMQGYSWATQ